MCRNGHVDNIAFNPIYPAQPGYHEICDEGILNDPLSLYCSSNCQVITWLYKCDLPGGTICYPACGDGHLDNGPANEPITYAYNEVCDQGIPSTNPLYNVGCTTTCTVHDPRYACAPVGTICTPLCGNGAVNLGIPLNWPTVDGNFYEVCDYNSATVEYGLSEYMFLTDKFKTCCLPNCQWDTTRNYLGRVTGQVIFRETWSTVTWDSALSIQ